MCSFSVRYARKVTEIHDIMLVDHFQKKYPSRHGINPCLKKYQYLQDCFIITLLQQEWQAATNKFTYGMLFCQEFKQAAMARVKLAKSCDLHLHRVRVRMAKVWWWWTLTGKGLKWMKESRNTIHWLVTSNCIKKASLISQSMASECVFFKLWLLRCTLDIYVTLQEEENCFLNIQCY